jgi:type VI secretion system protein VasI
MKNLLSALAFLTVTLFCVVDTIGQGEDKIKRGDVEDSEQSINKGKVDPDELRTALELRAALKKAAIIKDDVVRLAAYDEIMEQFKLAPATRSIKTKSKWVVTEKSNPIDDSKTTVLMLDANETVGSGFQKSTPRLILRRMQGGLDLYISVNQFLGSDSMQVTTRVDKKKAVISSWSISTNHKAAFSPAPTKFLEELATAEKLVVSLTPYSESPILFTFALSGLAELAPKVR